MPRTTRTLASSLVAALCVLHITPVEAQTLAASAATVDSANAARTAWTAALRAYRNQDIATARREMERAAAAWPSQQTYVWNRAWLAALAMDTAAVQAGLDAYVRMGLGRDVSDSAFDRYRALPWFSAVAAALDANRAPRARSRVVAQLRDSTLWPEGVDYDPRTGAFYVASIRHRTIVERLPNGAERALWPAEQPGIVAVMGVRVDTARNVLWASTSGLPQMAGYSPADSATAALLEIRISDGRVLRRWDIPRTRIHALGDLVIGHGGEVFMTDSYEPVLYRLRSDRDTLEAIRNPLFRSLQGIAVSPADRVLYVADYSHGLLRVDLATGAVIRLPHPPTTTTLGVDGIVWYDNAIIAVQNGVVPARVMRFTLDASGRRIVSAEVLDRNSAVADEPTIGTLVGDEFVYVANSQWEKYSDEGALKPDARLARPMLLAVPLAAH